MAGLSCEMMGLPTDQCGLYCAIRGCSLNPNQKPSPEDMKKRRRPHYVQEVLQELPPNERPSGNSEKNNST